MSLLGLILLFQFLFISGGSSRNLLYPCGKAESIYGLDFVNVYSKFSLESVIKKEILVKVAPWLGRTYISVNCSWRGLTKIPQNLPANVEGLVLQSNVIKQIRANDFLFFPNITLLTLYANCIPSNLRWPFPPCSGDLYIEPGTFQHLVHLKWLGLAGNYLREFPRQLPLCLKGLDISFTMLGDVSAQLQRLNNLTMLFGIRNCESPTELFCPRNFTITQPLSSSLKVINLSNNGWRKIPSYLLGDQLEALSIAANHITRLRKDASDNTKLPGFYPKCTLEIDQYFGGCVACQSPQYLCGRSVSRYGFNTSCDLQKHLKYTIAFTVYFILFCTSGIIGYSKWFKRLIFRKVNEYFRVQSLKPSDDIIRQQTFENKGAFVFFDHNNDKLGDWVDNNLVPGMINGNLSIELLLAGRDIEGGSFSMENLLRLVLKSRKTIVIFSGSFCETPICRFVLTALQELQYSAGRDQLILVEWHSEEAARVPELIQRTFNRKFYNFLRFHQTNDDEVMFFETLRTALASSVILGD
ncbi:toll-like receptor 2 type-2 isoform X3 [Clavelina lepadiformis]|uniref:toll-like receptor 2 type-2 isoform X3 n=1 Tax=Clavelina lepadiformis TaxID=159417 RepID=UPI0040410E16